MLIPPWLLILRIGRFFLPLPVVLLWPVLVVLAAVLYLLLPLAALVAWPFGRARVVWVGLPRLLALFCAFRGLRVDCSRGQGPRVLVEIR